MYNTQEKIHEFRKLVSDYETFKDEFDTMLKKSNFKMTFFADALEMKRTTFYVKRKQKSFTTKEYKFLLELLMSAT